MPADFYISDLHISPETASINALFNTFLDRDLADARSLTINGDFFNYHVGYKQFRYPFYDAMGKRLQALVARGVEVDFVAGNRDFLLARDAKLYGMRGFKDSVTRSIGA